MKHQKIHPSPYPFWPFLLIAFKKGCAPGVWSISEDMEDGFARAGEKTGKGGL
ncbi:MAG: hypothetical protein ACFFBV_11980 [Promethearchaeota archaeon]